MIPISADAVSAAPFGGRRNAAWVGTFVPSFDRHGAVKTGTLVDIEDAAWASERRWHLNRDGYFYRNCGKDEEGSNIALHREIMDLSHGDPREVDHINRCRTDNRRSNLRLTDRVGNIQNASTRADNKSGFKGVSYFAGHPNVNMKRRWKARAYHRGKEKSLGYFETPEAANEAIVAYRAEHYPCATD